MKQTSSRRTANASLGKVRDTAIAVVLLALGMVVVIYYQRAAANAEPVSIASDTSGAASGMLGQGSGGALGTPIERWVAGPHADTFVVAADGTNSTCARCHDPLNYVPTMDDMPASCSVCKFKVEPPPPFTAQTDAHHIDCKVCHKVDSGGTVLAGLSWLEVPAIEQYADVSTVSQLCQNCHTGADAEGHADIRVTGAHETLACNDCHDPHSMQASCTSSGCHESIEQIPGHDTDHANVHCVACHDTTGMESNPVEARGGQWVTFATGEDGTSFPFVSHELGAGSNCDRCHVEVLPGKYK